MHETDFWDRMRDDAGDALARHAYADWCDERGRVSEAEFYRLSGDLIEAEPWSVDERLIEARMDRVHEAIMRPKWMPIVRAIPWPTWSSDGGLILLHHLAGPAAPPLIDDVCETAREVPLYHLPVGEGFPTPDAFDTLDFSWLRSARLGQRTLYSRTSPPADWLAELRSLTNSGNIALHPRALADKLPKLHRLIDHERLRVTGAEDFSRLTELRELDVTVYSREEFAPVFRSLPASLQTLTLRADQINRGRWERISEDVRAGLALRSLEISVEDFSAQIDSLSRLPLPDTLEDLTVGIGGIASLLNLPKRPQNLRRLSLDIRLTDAGLVTFGEQWCSQLRHLSLDGISVDGNDGGPGESAGLFASLADSETLRELHVNNDVRLPLTASLAGTPLASRLEAVTVIGAEELQDFARADWPALRSLTLHVLPTDTASAQRTACDSDLFERMECVSIYGCWPDPDALVNLIGRLGPNLRVLELICGTPTKSLVEALHASAAVAEVDRFILFIGQSDPSLTSALDRLRADHPHFDIRVGS